MAKAKSLHYRSSTDSPLCGATSSKGVALSDRYSEVTCKRCLRLITGEQPEGYGPRNAGKHPNSWASGQTKVIRVPVLLADKLLEIARLADQCEAEDPLEFLEEVRWHMEWKPEDFIVVKPVNLSDLRQQRRGKD